MAKAIKTNVLRHLDALKIPYETREYTVDDDNFDGKLVAEKVDLPAEMIYKTLVLVGDTLPLTGYLRGGCSPIGMKKAFPTFVDSAAQHLERVSVSAGVRGCQVILAVDALVACTKAKFADLCRG